MEVGLPLEVKIGEKRVAMLPSDVEYLISQGFKVNVPINYGQYVGLSHRDYAYVGAKILDSNREVYLNSSLIVKVKEPQEEDLKYLTRDHKLFCFLHLASSRELTERIIKIGCCTYAFEMVVDHNGSRPLLKPMSQIAGKIAADVGLQFLRIPYGSKAKLSDCGQPKVKAIVLGAGNVGLECAKRLDAVGVEVLLLDNDPDYIQSLISKHVFRSEYSKLGVLDLNFKWHRLLNEVDIIVGASLAPGLKAPMHLKKSQLQLMEARSLTISMKTDR